MSILISKKNDLKLSNKASRAVCEHKSIINCAWSNRNVTPPKYRTDDCSESAHAQSHLSESIRSVPHAWKLLQEVIKARAHIFGPLALIIMTLATAYANTGPCINEVSAISEYKFAEEQSKFEVCFHLCSKLSALRAVLLFVSTLLKRKYLHFLNIVNLFNQGEFLVISTFQFGNQKHYLSKRHKAFVSSAIPFLVSSVATK